MSKTPEEAYGPEPIDGTGIITDGPWAVTGCRNFIYITPTFASWRDAWSYVRAGVDARFDAEQEDEEFDDHDTWCGDLAHMDAIAVEDPDQPFSLYTLDGTTWTVKLTADPAEAV